MGSRFSFEFSRRQYNASVALARAFGIAVTRPVRSAAPVEPASFAEAVAYVDVADFAALADGAEIASFTDRAGNAFTSGATGQGKLYRPTYFGGAAGIDSSSQWWKAVGTAQPAVAPFNGQPGNTPWTMLDVRLVRSSQLNYVASLCKSTASSRHLSLRANTNELRYQVLGGTAPSGAQATVTAPIDAWFTNCACATFVWHDGTNDNYQIDGGPIHSVARSWSGTLDVDTYALGGQNQPGTPPRTNNDIFVLHLLWNRVLTPAERAEALLYVGARWPTQLGWKAQLGARLVAPRIFLFAGQSNCKGEDTTNPIYSFTASHAWMLGLDGFLKTLSEPAVDPTRKATNLPYDVGGASMCGGHAAQLRARGVTAPLLYINLGLDSTSAAAWNANLATNPPNFDNLIGISKHRMAEAAKALNAVMGSITTVSGEAESDTAPEPETWDDNTQGFTDHLIGFAENDLGLSFLKPNAKVQVAYLSVNGPPVLAFWQTTRSVQIAKVAATPYWIGFQRPDGSLLGPSDLHLTNAEQKTMGELAADSHVDA